MDARIFREPVMGLEQDLLGLSLAERISYDASRNTLFANFEGLQVRTIEDVELIRREFERTCRAIGRKVHLIVNYDGFTLDEAVSEAYFSTITYLQQIPPPPPPPATSPRTCFETKAEANARTLSLPQRLSRFSTRNTVQTEVNPSTGDRRHADEASQAKDRAISNPA